MEQTTLAVSDRLKNEKKRRYYPADKYSIYSNEYDTQLKGSAILNKDQRRGFYAARDYDSLAGLQNIKRELTGNDKGIYLNEKYEERPAVIPFLKNQLSELDVKYQNWKQTQINMGYKVTNEWPEDLLNQKHRLEARLDISEQELEKINLEIQAIERQDKKNAKERMLKLKPLGTGSGIPLRAIDGQKVAPDKHGLLRINDERSPYNQMLVADYRTWVVDVWKKEKAKMFREQRLKIESGELRACDANMSLRPKLPEWPKHIKNPNEKI